MPRQNQQASEIDKLPHIQWWSQQLQIATGPLIQLQLMWVENMAETMQLEATYLHNLARCGQQIVGTPTAGGGQSIQDGYRQAMEEMATAHRQRMHSVAKLSSKFRKQLWEEI